jgi:hypothetical protein
VSARGIINGVLFRVPQTKVSKAGKPYAIATIREGSGDSVRWWKAFVFSESAIEDLMRLEDGDPIAVAGAFDCELYTPDGGDSRLSWKVTADAVLAARLKPKPKGSRAPPSKGGGRQVATDRAASSEQGGRFDDDVPF